LQKLPTENSATRRPRSAALTKSGSMIAIYANLASALFALGAAVLWIASATVKTPTSFSMNVITTQIGDAHVPSGEAVGQGFGTSDELNDLGKALIKQSRLSSWAAGCAAVAAALRGALAILALEISN
jgi:hypothetical protein